MAVTPFAVVSRTRRAPVSLRPVHTIGLTYDAVVSPFGERYLSDEQNHRVVIERGPAREAFGSLGSGAGDFQFPRGLAMIAGPTREDSRLFVCDAWNHRVQVFDGYGAFVFAFGGRGARDGQFDVPSDIVVVTPRLPGDEDLLPSEREPMLAIADRRNHRVQVVTTDGVFVAAFGTERRETGTADAQSRAGWPYFRGAEPVLPSPSRLAWCDPHLDVVCAGGRAVRVDLAWAMLPTFEAWRMDRLASPSRAASHLTDTTSGPSLVLVRGSSR